MLVDYEKVTLALKEYVCTKGSHGQRDLLAEISRLEAAHTLEEGLPEKALRLYGVVVTDALIRPALGHPRVDGADGSDDLPERRSGEITSEEDTDAGADRRRGNADAGRAAERGQRARPRSDGRREAVPA